MKVTILPENITNYLPLINKVLPTHSQVPILSNVLLEANKDGFVISATDLEIATQIKIPAKIDREGGVTVPGKEFLEAINSLPKDKITIEMDKEIVVMTCRDNRIVFNTIAREEFPTLYKDKGELTSTFERAEFIDIFSYLTFSVSQEESRPQLTGVLIDTQDAGVSFVSTDGYRMSVKKQTGQKTKIKEALIVSVKLINEVISMKGESIINLYVNKLEGQVIFEVGDALVIGRMIEGNFPDYNRVIPKTSATTVVFERESLLQTVRLVSVFAKESSNIATLNIIGNTIKLETKSQGVGEGEAVVECQKTGDDNKIAFNIKYLLDLLKNVNDNSMELKLNSPSEPALFEIKEKNYLHVIMPIQVD